MGVGESLPPTCVLPASDGDGEIEPVVSASEAGEVVFCAAKHDVRRTTAKNTRRTILVRIQAATGVPITGKRMFSIVSVRCFSTGYEWKLKWRGQNFVCNAWLLAVTNPNIGLTVRLKLEMRLTQNCAGRLLICF